MMNDNQSSAPAPAPAPALAPASAPAGLSHMAMHDGTELAVIHEEAGAAREQSSVSGVFWLPGFRSDMEGEKAETLARLARRRGLACTRFDYSGHGRSKGAFEAGTISKWTAEALAVFARFCRPGTVIAGSSMGGWIALLMARHLARQGLDQAHDRGMNQAMRPVAGLMLLAPAPDFTEALMWKNFTRAERARLMTDGHIMHETPYGPACPVTRALIEDGRKNLLLGGPFQLGCPIAIMQGVRDVDVPFSHTLQLISCLSRDNLILSTIHDGDHRLSRPPDLRQFGAVLTMLMNEIDASHANAPGAADGAG